MKAFGPCALFQKLQGATGHGQGNALGMHGLRFIQTPQPGSGHHTSKNAGHRCGMETCFVKHTASDLADAGGHLHTSHISQQQVFTRTVLLAGHTEGRRKNGRCGMHHAARMGVVVVQAMDQQAIDQGRIAHRQMGFHAKHGNRPRAGAQVFHGQQGLLGKGVASRRQGDAQGIQDQVLCLCHHIGGDVAPLQMGGPTRVVRRNGAICRRRVVIRGLHTDQRF